jgi:hypothetical protein
VDSAVALLDKAVIGDEASFMKMKKEFTKATTSLADQLNFSVRVTSKVKKALADKKCALYGLTICEAMSFCTPLVMQCYGEVVCFVADNKLGKMASGVRKDHMTYTVPDGGSYLLYLNS